MAPAQLVVQREYLDNQSGPQLKRRLGASRTRVAGGAAQQHFTGKSREQCRHIGHPFTHSHVELISGRELGQHHSDRT